MVIIFVQKTNRFFHSTIIRVNKIEEHLYMYARENELNMSAPEA